MGGFLTLAGPAEAETRVRGSRFLALAAPATSEAAARLILEERAKRYFDATHHCAAWRFRNGSWRALDAGEPGGSAGAPILNALDTAGLLDAAVVVTRYFGGTKLGVGGLGRAYAEAAAAALAVAPLQHAVPAQRLTIRYPYEETAPVMRALEQCGASDVAHDYSEEAGMGVVIFVIPSDRRPDLDRILRDGTAGRRAAELLRETVLYRRAVG